MVRYAKDQPSGFTNRIERVAIVGAGGDLGRYITEELLKSGAHNVTALSRKGSPNKVPDGVKVAYIDYEDESSLVVALQGQQFLIIAIAVHAPPEYQSRLIQAAAAAGVPYVLPNSFTIDIANKDLMLATQTGDAVLKSIAEIEATKSVAWICLVSSLWYEYSLMMGPAWFGFDFPNKKLTYFDDGNTRVNLTTWAQTGRAIAGLVGLKELPEDENDTTPALSNWANKPLYVSSFLLSQKDMFESWKRITGDTDEDWTIEYQPSGERFTESMKRFKEAGDRRAHAQASFTRVFFPNGDGNYEEKYGLANNALGLPKEDLDDATRFSKKLLDEKWWPTFLGGRRPGV